MHHAIPRPPARALIAPPLHVVCCFLLISLSFAVPCAAGAQEVDTGTTTSDRDWAYSTRGPTREQAKSDPNRAWWDQGPWFASFAAGPAWFDGDGMSGSADFGGEARLGFELSDDVSVVGSYTLAFAETERRPTAGGPIDDDTHDLHVLALGVGLRFDASPELQFFVEPKAGVLFGSDADVAPVGMVSGGVLLSVREGIALRLAVTGFVTDSDIDTSGTDAHLDGGVIVNVGVSFEF